MMKSRYCWNPSSSSSRKTDPQLFRHKTTTLLFIVSLFLYVRVASADMPVITGGIGPQKTLVLSIAPPGGSYSADQPLIDFVMGQVDDAYRKASNNQTWFTGIKNQSQRVDTFFYTLSAFNPTQCAPDVWATEAETAAGKAGYPVSSYILVVPLLPQSACRGHGFSGVGSRYAYANGANQVTFRVISHEIGHARFAWHHANLESCSAYIDCGYQEYGDSPDIMSNTGEDDLNGFERERAGWAKYPVVGPGTY